MSFLNWWKSLRFSFQVWIVLFWFSFVYCSSGSKIMTFSWNFNHQLIAFFYFSSCVLTNMIVSNVSTLYFIWLCFVICLHRSHLSSCVMFDYVLFIWGEQLILDSGLESKSLFLRCLNLLIYRPLGEIGFVYDCFTISNNSGTEWEPLYGVFLLFITTDP